MKKPTKKIMMGLALLQGLSLAACGPDSSSSENKAQSVYGPPPTSIESQDDVQDVYGPPPTEYQEEPQDVYGPPPTDEEPVVE